jgi:hypothetical protein
MLPNAPSINEKERKLIQEGIQNAYYNPSNQKRALALALSQGINEEVIAPFFNQDLETLFQQLKTSPIKDMVNDVHITGAFMRAFNEYFLFIFPDPSIQTAHKDLSRAFVEWQLAKPEKKGEFLKQMNESQQNLRHALKTNSMQYLKNHPLRKEADQMIEIIDEKQAQEINNRLMGKIEALEEKLFAFPITNKDLKLYVHLLVNIHLKFFNAFLTLELLNSNQSIDEATMRKNYHHFNSLLAAYYLVAINSRIPSGIAFTLKKVVQLIEHLNDGQIKTVKLKETNLSDIVDLEPIVSHLKIA